MLKEYVARGTYIYPAGPSLRLVADIFRFVTEEGMSFNPISVSGYHMREAGATAVQEVGFTLANALEYMRVATDAVQLFGAAGISNEYPINRYFRDAKVVQIIEGTNQIQRNIVADSVLGRVGKN